MLNFSIAFAAILLLSASIQFLLAVGFTRALRKFRPVSLPNSDCPPARVILSLRGADPFLGDCLAANARMNYPDYEMFVVLDAPGDPAEEIVDRTFAEGSPVPLVREYLRDPPETASLKCAALAQAIENLPEKFEFIATVDADVVPHTGWLRELAEAFHHAPECAAVTGNRWYMPSESNTASVARYLWNAAAVVQMNLYGISWGGTHALRKRTLQEANVAEVWRHGYSDDTVLSGPIARTGRGTVFQPALVMVNRERCDFLGWFRFVRRQLIAARMHHRSWPLVVGHGLSTALGSLTAVTGAIYAVLTNQMPAAWWLIGGFLTYQAILLASIPMMERAVRRIVTARGEPVRWFTWRTALVFMPALAATQILYPLALIAAIFARGFQWRGIDYSIEPQNQLKRLNYRPFPKRNEHKKTESI